MKPKFFFDYIYYRMTKLYFKWDGRTGGTALVSITMIQVLLVMDVIVFVMRMLYERDVTKNYGKLGEWVILFVYVAFIIYNYKKYNGSYNKLRFYWKNETRRTRIVKGILVVLSLVLPWIPIILIGIFM